MPYLAIRKIKTKKLWNKGNSPYIISWQGNGLTLRAKLTIEAGTVIKFYANRWWNEYFSIKVEGDQGGSLQVLGTAEETVVFTSFSDNPEINNDYWGGLVFESGSRGSSKYTL